jgi:hypothetical protein
MGEIADMMLEGVLCETCGVYLDGEAPGHPRYCEDHQEIDYAAIREAKRVEKSARLSTFRTQIEGDPTWQALSDNHFRKTVDGNNRFDYWPSTMKVSWRAKIFHGVEAQHIESFIENRRNR